VSIVELGQELAVVVEDNGSGVPESIRDAMFDPDVTTRPEGTGLGLTLVKGVLEAHGGSIEYDRSPLGGARFTCRLPAQEDTVDRTFTPRPGRRRQSLGG
jgi:two-component system sensor histidine kinase HupT/HoxJ